MLQQKIPEDYVLATGITTSIREFIKLVFEEMNIIIDFKGKNQNEIGYVVSNESKYKLDEGDVIIKVDPNYYRPSEVDLLIGDPSKAKKKLNWKPKYNLKDLIKDMVNSDLNFYKKSIKN